MEASGSNGRQASSSRRRTWVRIYHRPTGVLLAEGRRGWHMLPLEGNWYVSRRAQRGGRWRTTAVPGLCFYKGLYLWASLEVDGKESRFLGWRYVLANPLFFFVWNRIGLPGHHPELEVQMGWPEPADADTAAEAPRRGNRREPQPISGGARWAAKREADDRWT